MQVWQVAPFVPPNCKPMPSYLNSWPGRKYFPHYASSGRVALVHIIKSFGPPFRVLLPALICESVRRALLKAGIEPVYYDICEQDLNGSVDALLQLAEEKHVKRALLASLYGNPAELNRAENLCKYSGIMLIDDAAQSYGATLENRPVGSFGDAGFFSFSPGKATAGHMGAFFRCNNFIEIQRTKHALLHFVKWKLFEFGRQDLYRRIFPLIAMRIWTTGNGLIDRYFDLTFDGLSEFEKKIIGGILSEIDAGAFLWRSILHTKISNHFAGVSRFRVVAAVRGQASPHKFVVICETRDMANHLKFTMLRQSIFVGDGYKICTRDRTILQNAVRVEGRVVEFPLENNPARMAFMVDRIENWAKQ